MDGRGPAPVDTVVYPTMWKVSTIEGGAYLFSEGATVIFYRLRVLGRDGAVVPRCSEFRPRQDS